MATLRICDVLTCVAWCMASIVGAELVQSVGTSQAALVAPVSIPPEGAHAKAAAEIVMSELSRVSETGIYSSLHLHRIVQASVQEGSFVNATFLVIELTSPHLASELNVSLHHVRGCSARCTHGALAVLLALLGVQVGVLEHLDGGAVHVTIDDFPRMSEDEIESRLDAMADAAAAARGPALLELAAEGGDDVEAQTIRERWRQAAAAEARALQEWEVQAAAWAKLPSGTQFTTSPAPSLGVA